MTKNKLTSEERENEKTRKEQNRGLLTGLEIKEFSDIQELFKEKVGEVMQNGLGYTKYDYRNKETGNSKNGYSNKSVKTSCGDVEIRVPRDRNGEFEPQLIKKQQTTLTGDIEEKIISMYAKGMTTSDIEAHIQEIYGLE